MALSGTLAIDRWWHAARERMRRRLESRAYTDPAGRRRFLRIIMVVLVVLSALYYPLGMAIVHRVNDDVSFETPERLLPANGSRAVAMATALISREVNDTPWVANSPWFLPSSALDNMPNFQIGLFYALSRFTMEMTDILGRMRGTSQVDPDLDRASGLLKYDGTIWVWEPSTSLMPTASAEKQYRAAARSLVLFNERLGRGEAVFDRRADNLIGLLDRIGADLGSQSAILDRQAVESNAGWWDSQADDIFYATKGRLYGYYMLLRELRQDFAEVIHDRRVGGVWNQMLDSLRIASEMDPLIISNGSNDGLFTPSHLAVQGFYLLRARTRLQEVANILMK
jgi:hypothetical protein